MRLFTPVLIALVYACALAVSAHATAPSPLRPQPKAASMPYVEFPAYARELVRETSTATHYHILRADCRTADTDKVSASILPFPTECLVIAQNGPGKPLFCGKLFSLAATVSNSALFDIDHAEEALKGCGVVRTFLARLPQRYVARYHTTFTA